MRSELHFVPSLVGIYIYTRSCLNCVLRFFFNNKFLFFWCSHFVMELGYLELTLGDKENISKLHQEWLTTSKESGEFLLETINRILDFQKLEHGSACPAAG